MHRQCLRAAENCIVPTVTKFFGVILKIWKNRRAFWPKRKSAAALRPNARRIRHFRQRNSTVRCLRAKRRLIPPITWRKKRPKPAATRLSPKKTATVQTLWKTKLPSRRMPPQTKNRKPNRIFKTFSSAFLCKASKLTAWNEKWAFFGAGAALYAILSGGNGVLTGWCFTGFWRYLSVLAFIRSVLQLPESFRQRKNYTTPSA